MGSQKDYNRNYREKHKLEGKCAFCPRPKLENTVRCRYHFFKDMAQSNLKKCKLGTELEKIFEAQNGKCYITGRSLILGENASVDHIIPRSRGGNPFSIENVKWCAHIVNLAKNNMTISELLTTCEEILRNKESLLTLEQEILRNPNTHIPPILPA